MCNEWNYSLKIKTRIVSLTKCLHLNFANNHINIENLIFILRQQLKFTSSCWILKFLKLKKYGESWETRSLTFRGWNSPPWRAKTCVHVYVCECCVCTCLSVTHVPVHKEKINPKFPNSGKMIMVINCPVDTMTSILLKRLWVCEDWMRRSNKRQVTKEKSSILVRAAHLL